MVLNIKILVKLKMLQSVTTLTACHITIGQYILVYRYIKISEMLFQQIFLQLYYNFQNYYFIQLFSFIFYFFKILPHVTLYTHFLFNFLSLSLSSKNQQQTKIIILVSSLFLQSNLENSKLSLQSLSIQS
jgi:hypothetical protein